MRTGIGSLAALAFIVAGSLAAESSHAADTIETWEVNVVSYRPRSDLYYWPVLAALLISLALKFSVITRTARLSKPATAAPGTVHVDPRTGRLEVLQ